MRSLFFFGLFNLMLLVMYQFLAHPQLRFNSFTDRLTHPFDHRLRYRIGEVDPRFNLSFAEAQALAFEATQIWEQQTRKRYFVYDPDAQLTIHLVYDQRQQQSTARRQKKLEIDQHQQLWVQKQDELNKENDYLASMFQHIEQKKQELENKIKSYKLQEENLAMKMQDFQLEDQNLKSKIEEFNQRVAGFNQQVSELNQMNIEIDNSINNFNQLFQPRLFDKGIFNGKEIVIYEFNSEKDLRLTLAHEFGHALGLIHHHDPEGLMYPMMEKQKQDGFELTPADLVLLANR